MPKIPDCDRCLYFSYNQYLICAVHPNGQNSPNCPDFQENLEVTNGKFVDFLNLLQQVEDSDNQEPFSNPFSLSDEEQWEPEGASYYNGELILQRKHQRIREEQLWLLEHHPMFTGVCPECKYRFLQVNFHIVHFDCPNCGWVDDSV